VVSSWGLEGFSAGKFIHLSDHQIKYIQCQTEIMAATKKLHPLLERHQGDSSWHNDAAIYLPGTERPWGLLNLSPAWFQKAHEVISLSMQNIVISS